MLLQFSDDFRHAKMDFFDCHYYRINKLILSFIGLWPYQRMRMRAVSIIIAALGLVSFSVPQIIYAVIYIDDVEKLLGVMPTSIGGIILTSKALALMCKNSVIRDLFDQMHKDWDILMNDAEEDILKKYAEFGRKFTIGYAIFAVTPVIGYTLLPLNAPILDIILPLNDSRVRVLPNPGEYFVDQDKYFYLLLISQYYGYLIGILVVLGCDGMYIAAMQHSCGMFAVLSHRLENALILGDGPNDDEEVYRHVVGCIRLHLQTKRFTELIVTAFTTFLLVDIGLGIVLHSTSCVMIVIHTGKSADAIQFWALAASQSIQLFLKCWPGQKLMDHSTNVSIAAYNGLWYYMPLKVRTMLLLIIMRSQHPCKITIAGLYVVNLDSYGAVMKTSVSYCTVMASLHDSSVE